MRDYRVQSLMQLAGDDLALARIERALVRLSVAERLAPGDAIVQSEIGRVEMMRHEWRRDADAAERALDAYRSAIARNPRDAEHHTDLGWALTRLGHFDEAEAAFLAALALDPNNIYYISSLGRSYEASERYELALATYERAQAVLPTNQVRDLIRALEGR